MKNKITVSTLLVLILLVFSACVSTPKTGFAREKMNVANLLGYSDNEINIEVAKAIWNNKIVITELVESSEYLGIFDLSKPNEISIFIDSSIQDLDYSLELATVISYFAYILKNPNAENLENKALVHAQSTYKAIIKNIKMNNPKVNFLNPRNFEQFLESKDVELRTETIFKFSNMK